MVSGRLPGAVIGQVFRAGTSTPRDFPRYAGIIAKGLDLKLFRDAALVRCAVEGEQLPFSGVTYIAPLVNPAVPDKARSRLYTSDGRTVAQTRWNFTQSIPGSNVYDQISIDPSIFSTTLTYLVDYVSTDTSLRDPVPVDELREVLALGDNQGQIRYREGRDYRFTTTATGPLPGTGNFRPFDRAISPAAGNNLLVVASTGTGVVKISSSAAYTHNYNRSYLVTCTASGGSSPNRTATFRVDCLPTSSGTDALPGLSASGAFQSNSIVFTVDESDSSSFTQALEHGLVLDFTGAGAPDFGFGSINFVNGDTFTFSAYGPGLMELDDKLINTNQFAETSAVTADIDVASQGEITINPQTNYLGVSNQVYEIECVELPTPAGASRSARFAWRTNAKLKALSGTVTAVGGSATVTGSGTSFTTEVQAGDWVLLGNSTSPVLVQTVVSATSLTLASAYPDAGLTAAGSTTTVIQIAGRTWPADLLAGRTINVGGTNAVVLSNTATAITLTAPLGSAPSGGTAYAITSTTKALRIRESKGSFLVSANGNNTGANAGAVGPNRVALDQGIFIDLSFGSTLADNFVVGDTFSFTAKVARNDYNGKENRNYDLTVTSVATPHAITATFVGNTPASTFGSQVFNEGTPLVLPNNAVVYARNLTVIKQSTDARFTSTPISPSTLPDTFELSLTFDGLIDWTPETQVTETIGSQEILRDLTGSVTGTVGAYFVLTRKVPTTVVFVSGPSPAFSTIAYNQVAGTTVIYFTTNPGVALTIKYRHAGIEPSAGSSYFMTGYIKRPDSDYTAPQLFTSRDAAREFLAPMTVTNDAAIANECAWDQDQVTLPGVVVCLVKDSDGDGVFTTADYDNAIRVSEQFKGTTDFVVVNQFAAREEFRDSVVNMNDPTVARRRIGYFGFPVSYPIGDEFTSDSRVFTARRELQVFEETVARGTLTIIGNSFGKKTILVDSLGDGAVDAIPTQVTLDGSFLAVALAARVASFREPWESIYNLPISGFDEVEALTETQMITLQDAGIICCRVEGGSAFYIGTMTTDSTEPSTQQLSGTVQRQYVLSRLQDVINRRVIGFVADSPEQAAQKLQGELVAELGAMVSERKIGKYVDPTTGQSRALNPQTDVIAFRDRRDPTRAYFRTSWYQKYPLLFVDGVVAVDAPTP
jgi:hypothetical protein